MLYENIRLALKSMSGSRMRTFLSLLGIVIGVASVVTIMNLGGSAAASMNASFETGGLGTISLMPRGMARETLVFTEDFAYTLMDEVEGIKEVLPSVQSSANVRNQAEISEGVPVMGVISGYFGSESLEAAAGRVFTAEENITRRQVCVIGPELADELFPSGDAVGQYVSVYRRQAKSFEVIGVLKEKDASLGSSFNGSLFMPYNTYTERFRRTDQIGTYTIKVADGYDAARVSEDIEEYLDTIIGDDYYSLFSPASLKEMVDEITGTFSTFLAAIAAISLAVGGIGIMNIMLVSVSERTGEIGIRKALGAAPKTIRMQFLVESAVLSMSGGFIGLLIGVILSFVGTRLTGWSIYISGSAVLVALVFPMAIGIFFGWYPAAKAARLEPMEALARD